MRSMNTIEIYSEKCNTTDTHSIIISNNMSIFRVKISLSRLIEEEPTRNTKDISNSRLTHFLRGLYVMLLTIHLLHASVYQIEAKW